MWACRRRRRWPHTGRTTSRWVGVGGRTPTTNLQPSPYILLAPSLSLALEAWGWSRPHQTGGLVCGWIACGVRGCGPLDDLVCQRGGGPSGVSGRVHDPGDRRHPPVQAPSARQGVVSASTEKRTPIQPATSQHTTPQPFDVLLLLARLLRLPAFLPADADSGLFVRHGWMVSVVTG